MSVGDWYREKKDVQSEYDYGRISREKYEIRTRFAIGMIYKCGNDNDKETAKRMAKLRAYDIEYVIKEVM